MKVLSLVCLSRDWCARLLPDCRVRHRPPYPHRLSRRLCALNQPRSNAKDQWAAAKPMDCEERLLEQAAMTKALNPDTHTWVYRNLVKVSELGRE